MNSTFCTDVTKTFFTSAKIEAYILEKFRVTEPNENEKNFHAFYAMFAGMSESELQDLELEEMSEYRYLSTSGILKPCGSLI